MLLLPLAHESQAEARVLGALAPMAAPYWLGAKAVGPLKLGMLRHIGAAVEATPVAALCRRSRAGCGTAWWSIRAAGRTEEPAPVIMADNAAVNAR